MTPTAIRPAVASFYGATVNEKALSPYLKRLNKTRSKFMQNGLDAYSTVFITSLEVNDDADIDDNGEFTGTVKSGQTVEMTGHYAAIRIAEKSHRLATQKEIDQFRADQRRREVECAETEAKRPDKPMTAGDLVAAINKSNMADTPARPVMHKSAGQENKN